MLFSEQREGREHLEKEHPSDFFGMATLPISYVLEFLAIEGFKPRSHVQAVEIFDAIVRTRDEQGRSMRARPVLLIKQRKFDKDFLPKAFRLVSHVVLE